MKKRQLLPVFFVLFISCHAAQTPKNEDLYKKCMAKFQDAGGCREMLGMQENKSTEPAADETRYYIRKLLKNRLQGKNRQYVVSLLGQPQKAYNRGGYRYYYYNQPLTRYAKDSQPDRDLTVVFQKGMVSRVDHTGPPEKEERKQ